MSSPPLRGLRATRRVWSSDEEEPPKKPASTTASGPRKPGEFLRADLDGDRPKGFGAGPVVTQSNVTPRSAGSSPGRRALNAVGLTPSAPVSTSGTPISSAMPTMKAPLTQPMGNSPRTSQSTDADGSLAQLRSELRTELRDELKQATTAIKAQAKEWKELIGLARGEMAGLSQSVKGASDSTTRSVVEQRKELEKMLESSRRLVSSGPAQNKTMGERHSSIGEDIAAISGGLSASQVVDVQRELIYDLEGSLTVKIGFIGGLFHTWRCEVVLAKQSGEFGRTVQRAKEHRREQAELMIARFLLGDTKGLLLSCHRDWKKTTQDSLKNRVMRHRIQMAANKWLMGGIRGLLTTVWTAWGSKAIAERHRAAFETAAADFQRMHDEEIDRLTAAERSGWEALERHHKKAKEDLFLVLAKWEMGDKKGLLEGCFKDWQEFIKDCKEKQKKTAKFKEMMDQWWEGNAKGLMRSVFGEWKAEARHNSAVANERRKLDELLSGQQAELEEEMAQRQSEEQRKHQAAKESVKLMVRKWEMGNTKGLLSEVIAAWHKFTAKWSALRASKASAQMAMARFLEGDRRGIMQTTFKHWHTAYVQAKQGGWHDARHQAQAKEFEAFLDDQRRAHDGALEAARRQAERAANTVKYALLSWEQGSKKAALLQTWKLWKTYAVNASSRGRGRQAVHIAMMKFLEGEKKGVMSVCIKNWHKWAHATKLVQEKEAAAEEQQRVFQDFLNERHTEWQMSAEAARRQSAQETAQMMVQKWLRGDKKGLLVSVLTDWNKYIKALRKRECQHESAKAAVLKFLLGEKRAMTQLCWTHWVQFHHTEEVHRAYAQREADQHAQKSKEVLDLEQRLEAHINNSKTKLLKYMAKMVDSKDPTFIVLLIAQWRAHSHGEKSAEMQRKLELDLEEQARLHDIKVTRDKEMKLAAMENMGFKSDKAHMMKMFLMWSAIFQEDRQKRIHELTHMNVMKKFGGYLEKMFSTGSSKEMLTTAFQEWHREARRERFHDLHGGMQELRVQVEQLTQERLALAEQLTIVYQQLDSVTDTLQKELKTKEELAKELREANEQVFQSGFGGGRHIDLQSIITNSRPTTPGSAVGSNRGDRGDYSQYVTSRRAPSEGKASTDGAYGNVARAKPWAASGSAASATRSSLRSPRSVTPTKGSDPLQIETQGLSPESTMSSISNCNWGGAISRMRDQGLLHESTAPRI